MMIVLEAVIEVTATVSASIVTVTAAAAPKKSTTEPPRPINPSHQPLLKQNHLPVGPQ
jgi:hypothetical protein